MSYGRDNLGKYFLVKAPTTEHRSFDGKVGRCMEFHNAVGAHVYSLRFDEDDTEHMFGMYELQPVDVNAWFCLGCRRCGAVYMEDGLDAYSGFQRVRHAHWRVSRECTYDPRVMACTLEEKVEMLPAVTVNGAVQRLTVLRREMQRMSCLADETLADLTGKIESVPPMIVPSGNEPHGK